MCDHKKKKYTRVHRNCGSSLARSNINTSTQGELSGTVPLNNVEKERKEVEHIKSKNRTHDERVFGYNTLGVFQMRRG